MAGSPWCGRCLLRLVCPWPVLPYPSCTVSSSSFPLNRLRTLPSPAWFLAVPFLLEGTAFARASRQAHAEARKLHRTVLGQVLNSSDPTMRALVAEDGPVLADIVLAFAGVLTHPLSGSARPAAGSIAVILIQKNRRFLVGRLVTAELLQSVARQLMDGTEKAHIAYLHLEYVGPRRLYLVATVDLAGGRVESEGAVRPRAIERRIESHEKFEAVLTVATADDPSLVFQPPLTNAGYSPSRPPGPGRLDLGRVLLQISSNLAGKTLRHDLDDGARYGRNQGEHEHSRQRVSEVVRLLGRFLPCAFSPPHFQGLAGGGTGCHTGAETQELYQYFHCRVSKSRRNIRYRPSPSWTTGRGSASGCQWLQ